MATAKSLLIGAILFLYGCSNPSLQSLPSDGVILAYGDSLTFGKGTDIDSSYPAELARLSGKDVINAGVSGETTAEGLQRLPSALDKTNPDLLLLMHGGNDILRNLGYESAKANLAAMINMAKDRGIQVVLIGVPEKRLLSSSAPFYKELADEHDLVFEKSIISKLLKKPGYKSDSVHFNAKGYAEIANLVFELLQANGAL